MEVIEYADDYCAAVEQGRRNSDQDPMSYLSMMKILRISSWATVWRGIG